MDVLETQQFIQRIIKSNGDVYRVLGLDARASAETIKKAYRRLVVKVHPDKCIDKSMKADCDIAFKIMQKSYERALAELSTNEPRKKQRQSPPPPMYQNNTPMTNAWNDSPEKTVPEWSPSPPPPPRQGISTRPIKTQFSVRRPRPFTSRSPVPPFGSDIFASPVQETSWDPMKTWERPDRFKKPDLATTFFVAKRSSR